MKKYLLIATLLLLCVRAESQDSFVTDTILSISNSGKEITIHTVKRTVVTITKTLLQKTVYIDPAVRLKFSDAVICNYLLYHQQPKEHHFLLSLTHGPARLSYNLYMKAGVIRFVEVYHWSSGPFILLAVYLLIMFGMDWLLFRITVFDEWGTWKEWLVNAVLGIGGGYLLAVGVLEDLSWNQIIVPAIFSIAVYSVARWRYKKYQRVYTHYGSATLIE